MGPYTVSSSHLCRQFELLPLGGQALKGIADPVTAFVVAGERLTETRFAAGRRDAAGAIDRSGTEWGRAEPGVELPNLRPPVPPPGRA